jgi:glutamine amidotransferase
MATTEYGQSFASAINHKNVYGIQFHPEKSHHNGVSLLKNFANL